MHNFNWINQVFFSISLILCITYLFSFPKTLIKYFLDRNNRTFFASDLNLFTSIYSNINIFFIYFVYAPFFYFRCFIRVNKFMTKEVYSISLRLLSIGICIHFLMFFYNHSDFSNRPINQIVAFINSSGKITDISYVLIQYSGIYRDFCMIFFFFSSIVGFFLENGNLSSCVNYPIAIKIGIIFYLKSYNKFWSAYKLIWFLRIYIYIFFAYFFCGDGIQSDCIVIGMIILCTEFVCFSIRFCFILKRYSRALIKRRTYLLLRHIFHICLKLLWNILFSLKTNIRFLMFKF